MDKGLYMLLGFLFGLFVFGTITFLIINKIKSSCEIQIQKIKKSTIHDFELLKIDDEIQKQTIDYISTEFHDQIGALISVINLNLVNIESTSTGENKKRVKEAILLLGELINSIRQTLHYMKPNFIKSLGLKNALENELNRIERTGFYEIKFTVKGEEIILAPEIETALFRMCQEILNNIIKHSRSKKIDVKIIFSAGLLSIQIQDYGIGFDYDKLKENRIEDKGFGLPNLKIRSELIDCTLKINSEIGRGTSISINLPIN